MVIYVAPPKPPYSHSTQDGISLGISLHWLFNLARGVLRDVFLVYSQFTPNLSNIFINISMMDISAFPILFSSVFIYFIIISFNLLTCVLYLICRHNLLT